MTGSTGDLSAAAKAMIEDAQNRAGQKGCTIEVFYTTDIDRQVKTLKDAALRKVVDQHFLLAPMALPDATLNPLSKRSVPQSLAEFESLSNTA